MAKGNYQGINTSDFMNEVKRLMLKDGLIFKYLPTNDEIHRCGIVGKENKKDGAYVVRLNCKYPFAWWRNWSTGIDGHYCSKPIQDMTEKERKDQKRFIKEAKDKADAEQAARYEVGAGVASGLWSDGTPVNGDGHSYLVKKKVQSFGLRTGKGNLFIPVMDVDENIKGLQIIKPSGEKIFNKGTQKKGNFFKIPAKDGTDNGPLVLAEGYATGASCHMATGFETWVAFDCYNFMDVSIVAREKYPTRKIVLCADYDVHKDERMKQQYPNPGGVGTAKAKEAALAIGGYLAVCPSIDGGKADFNDLAIHDGLPRVQQVIEKVVTGEPVTGCPIPSGYTIRKESSNPGLYWEKVDKEGNLEIIKIGPPITVLGESRDYQGNERGILLQWQDNDGLLHQWSMPKSLLYGQGADYLACLASQGWGGDPAYKKQLTNFFYKLQPVARVRCVSNLGWYKNHYVLPDQSYGPITNEKIVFQADTPIDLYQTGGTFEEWQKIASLCVGNPKLGFALSCAFAGPLLQLTGIESGAFSFEGGSSCGKTTALRIAGSVWGNNHVRSWRTTANGLEGTASLYNDNLCCLDELGQVEGKALDEAVYMLSNGQGKARASRNGSLRKSHEWRTVILSSGELGLADKLAGDGRKAKAGQQVRFCGIPVEKTDIVSLHGFVDAAQLIDKIQEVSTNNYGHAGRLFLKQLTEPQNLEGIKSFIQEAINGYVKTICPDNADPQVKRVARRFALAGYAGQLAGQFGILPEDFDSMAYAKTCFDAWLENRGGIGAREDAAILSQVKGIIERDGQSRFQDSSNPDAICINRLGFRKKKDNSDQYYYYCFPEAFKSEVIKGYNLKRAIMVLDAAGWLLKDEGKNQKTIRISGLGTRKFYCLSFPDESDA